MPQVAGHQYKVGGWPKLRKMVSPQIELTRPLADVHVGQMKNNQSVESSRQTRTRQVEMINMRFVKHSSSSCSQAPGEGRAAYLFGKYSFVKLCSRVVLASTLRYLSDRLQIMFRSFCHFTSVGSAIFQQIPAARLVVERMIAMILPFSVSPIAMTKRTANCLAKWQN